MGDCRPKTSGEEKCKGTNPSGLKSSGAKEKVENLFDKMAMANSPPSLSDISEDGEGLLQWWDTVDYWEENLQIYTMTPKQAARVFAEMPDKVPKGIRVFNKLFLERHESLQQHITDLNNIADDLDRFHQNTKIAQITGNSVSATGGIVTLTGLALAPFTFGASLVVTAVGLGIGAAGALTSAGAGISNEVNNSMDRDKVEKIIKDCQKKMEDLNKALEFIKEGLKNLQQFDSIQYQAENNFPDLSSKFSESAKAGLQIALIGKTVGNMAAGAAKIAGRATGVLSALVVGLDIYFVAKNSKELKNGAKSELATKIREAAKQLQDDLVELNTVRENLQAAAKPENSIEGLEKKKEKKVYYSFQGLQEKNEKKEYYSDDEDEDDDDDDDEDEDDEDEDDDDDDDDEDKDDEDEDDEDNLQCGSKVKISGELEHTHRGHPQTVELHGAWRFPWLENPFQHIDLACRHIIELAELVQDMNLFFESLHNIRRDQVIDFFFLAHGGIKSTMFSPEMYLRKPSPADSEPFLLDVILYEPWNCAINGNVAYGIISGKIKQEHCDFYCARECPLYEYNHDKDHHTFFPPSQTWNLMSQTKDLVAEIYLSTIGGPRDGAWMDTKKIRKRFPKYEFPKRNGVLYPFILPRNMYADVPFTLVTEALALVLKTLGLKARLHLVACLSKWDDDVELDMKALEKQYCVSPDDTVMDLDLKLTNKGDRKLHRVLKDMFG